MGKDVARGERWFLGNSSFIHMDQCMYCSGTTALPATQAPPAPATHILTPTTRSVSHWGISPVCPASSLPQVLWTKRWVGRRLRGTIRRKGITWVISCLTGDKGTFQSGGRVWAHQSERKNHIPRMSEEETLNQGAALFCREWIKMTNQIR